MTSVLLVVRGTVAGGLGALLGVGGGVILVPLLTLGFKIPLGQAIPASLACVVATSCGAGANYLERRLSDLRLALSLEAATVSGALLGGVLAARLPETVVVTTFGLFLLLVSGQMFLSRRIEIVNVEQYTVVRYPLGIVGSAVAGSLSAVLGVGGGPLKVPLMNVGMRVPFKVATATSNLMIGVTAAASLAGYAVHGRLNLALVAPLVVGVLSGASLGSRLMLRVPSGLLKRLFAVLLLAVGLEMLWKGGVHLWTQGPIM